jgi:LDH2 family malate/lactate/ureidoglycolate dehydrogenase
MLERFHVPEDIAIRVSEEDMRATVEEIFRKMGMPDDDAVQAADVLVYADISGIESHGVSNMLRAYVAGFGTGAINPHPEPKILFEAAAVATLDSDKGHGLVIGPQAMQLAIDRAEKYGIGSITVTNGTHFGAAAYHAAMALEHDMVGLAMTTGGVSVVAVHGAKPLVGLNPIAVAVPTDKEPPFIFDAAMSSVAGNKIRLAQRIGVNVMPGWISDGEGTPIMEDSDIPDDYMMLPLGGTREIGAHKGYSLAVMIEVLCAVLGGGGAGPFRRRGSSHHFVAYKVSAFGDLDVFKADMDEYLRALQDSPTAPGHDRVVYAGLPEHEERIERLENGIPYHPEVIEWFKGITAELGLADRFS